jgi:two-component system, OmpR family, phosphate regulon sensor histidine kinase PhoR
MKKITEHYKFTDNGIGISKKYRKKIFNRFYRIPTGNVHNVKGFGLGLDYVRKILKAHHWEIKVDENPTGGSIFT